MSLKVAACLMAATCLASCSVSHSDNSTVSSEPKPSTEAEFLSRDLDKAWASVISEYPDLKRPDVQVVQYAKKGDWATLNAKCLNEAGFPGVKATDNGAVDSGVIQDSVRKSYVLSSYICSAKFPLNPRYSVPLTELQVGKLYDYFVNFLKPCLTKEGYTVPSAPSRERFLSQYYLQPNGGWDIYGKVRVADAQEWTHINQKCPQVPDDLY